jgi:hypothetical protein
VYLIKLKQGDKQLTGKKVNAFTPRGAFFFLKGIGMTKDRARYKAVKYREWSEKAAVKSAELHKQLQEDYKHFDFTQPILVGHHSERRHRADRERYNNKMQQIFDLDNKAKEFLERAANLEQFANTNKGDAERKRDEKRQANDALIRVGSKIFDVVYREGEVLKVNKKTYTVKWATGSVFTRDKSFVQILE